MKISMVIPSYWGRRKSEHSKSNEVSVYDHPTYLDEDGTIGTLLDSLDILKDKDFKVIIIGCPNTPDIEDAVEDKLNRIIIKYKDKYDISLFSSTQIKELKSNLKLKGHEELSELITLRGYSNVRNMCILAPHLQDSDVALLIDDDEAFSEPDFVKKALEFIGERDEEGYIYGKAGYYLQGLTKEYLLNTSNLTQWQRDNWNMAGDMNKAFNKIIGKPPRIKDTPFVFGGNMILHKEMFTKISFDPGITRGEDIDYLINAKMFGFRFVLDNELSINHLQPKYKRHHWKRFREDMKRFLFLRDKINSQRKMDNMRYISAESLFPYPGPFLKDDLEERIFSSINAMEKDYRASGDKEGIKETEENRRIAEEYLKNTNYREKVFDNLLSLQKRWQRLMEVASL